MKLICLLAFTFFAVTTGTAQQKRDTVHRNSPASGKTKMKDELGLDKKQTVAVKASKKEYKAEKQKVTDDAQLSATEKKTKLKQLKKEHEKKVDAVLTQDQKAKQKEWKKEKKAKKKAEKAAQ